MEGVTLSEYIYGAKTVVSLRDPDNIGDTGQSTMRFVNKKGFVIYPMKDWKVQIVDIMPFYTCAMQRVDLSMFE